MKKLGKSILKNFIPNEVEIKINTPPPLQDVASLRVKWEKEENRKFSDEKLLKRLEALVEKERKRKLPIQKMERI